MKVAVLSTVNFKNVDLSKYLPQDTTMLISGGTTGAEAKVEEYAALNKIECLIFRGDDEFLQGVPYIWRKTIVANADIVLAFWDGEDIIIRFAIDYAQKHGIEVRIIT